MGYKQTHTHTHIPFPCTRRTSNTRLFTRLHCAALSLPLPEMGWFWPFDTIFFAAVVVVCAFLPPSVSRALVLSLVSAGVRWFFFCSSLPGTVLLLSSSFACFLTKRNKTLLPMRRGSPCAVNCLFCGGRVCFKFLLATNRSKPCSRVCVKAVDKVSKFCSPNNSGVADRWCAQKISPTPPRSGILRCLTIKSIVYTQAHLFLKRIIAGTGIMGLTLVMGKSWQESGVDSVQTPNISELTLEIWCSDQHFLESSGRLLAALTPI